MDVQKLLRNPRFRLEQGNAAGPDTVKQFQDGAPPNLPRTYLRFMQACNGARGTHGARRRRSLMRCAP